MQALAPRVAELAAENADFRRRVETLETIATASMPTTLPAIDDAARLLATSSASEPDVSATTSSAQRETAPPS